MEEAHDAELIDEDPPAELADVPVYGAPPAQILGEVEPTETPPELGSIPSTVTFTADAIPRPPFGEGPPQIDAVKEYFTKQRDELVGRIAQIESLLGFVDVADDLAVRVAKLERFVGIAR